MRGAEAASRRKSDDVKTAVETRLTGVAMTRWRILRLSMAGSAARQLIEGARYFSCDGGPLSTVLMDGASQLLAVFVGALARPCDKPEERPTATLDQVFAIAERIQPR